MLDWSCFFPQLIENIYHRRSALRQALAGRFMKSRLEKNKQIYESDWLISIVTGYWLLTADSGTGYWKQSLQFSIVCFNWPSLQPVIKRSGLLNIFLVLEQVQTLTAILCVYWFSYAYFIMPLISSNHVQCDFRTSVCLTKRIPWNKFYWRLELYGERSINFNNSTIRLLCKGKIHFATSEKNGVVEHGPGLTEANEDKKK
jgi:hypothetical protein